MEYVEFNTMYRMAYGKLLNVAFLGTKELSTAQDIVQNCFMLLWEQWETFLDRANFHAYLFSAVHNACVNYWSEEWNRLEVTRMQLIEADALYHESIKCEDDIQAVYEAIDTLPLNCRQVVVLFYFGGKNNETIGTMMNISVHVVRKLKARAMELLQKKLSRQENDNISDLCIDQAVT
jgi:RNA polymerase sigma-70 factor (ECF subfamily)